MGITRRTVLKLGAAAALGIPSAQAREPLPLVTRAIPSSGVRIPIVGIGTNRYRTGSEADVAPLRETLKTFAALGGSVIDTAPMYGSSELVLGQLIAELGLRDRLFIATKVYTSGRASGEASLRESLARLKTALVDLMQVHNMSDTDTQLALLADGKAAGRFRHIGVTTSQDRQYDDVLAALQQHKLDFVQVDYSLDNRTAAERILPMAADKGVAVLVNLPFGRARLFSSVRGHAVPDWAAEFDCSSWAQFFLKYVLGHPAVTCAIPGTTKPHHATDNNGAARGRMPDAAMRRRMEQFFDSL